MKAIHFGAGNIGRGFVGLLLHEAGYEVVFADVDAPLIEALRQAPTYTVHEAGETPTDKVVDNFRAINSATDEAELINEIATADAVTTAELATMSARSESTSSGEWKETAGSPLCRMRRTSAESPARTARANRAIVPSKRRPRES